VSAVRVKPSVLPKAVNRTHSVHSDFKRLDQRGI
jgi:hypothetical protein